MGLFQDRNRWNRTASFLLLGYHHSSLVVFVAASRLLAKFECSLARPAKMYSLAITHDYENYFPDSGNGQNKRTFN